MDELWPLADWRLSRSRNVEADIRSCAPGGIDAQISEHFGHCDLFTLVEVDNGEVTKVDALPGISHQHGGCMVPVDLLAIRGVKILIAGGMGMRPLAGFNQVGIEVYKNGGASRVGQAIQALLNGTITRSSPVFSCASHTEGGCHDQEFARGGRRPTACSGTMKSE
jgi:predicted Fe-Mo cluster-binding NifX family protein